MKNHWIWMVISCVLPLLLIFFAPSIGIKGDTFLFAFIILMFAVHLLVPMRHENHKHGLTDKNLNKKDKKENKRKQHH